MRLIGFSVAAALALAACGGATDPLNGGGSGGSSVTGTVGGGSVSTTDIVGIAGVETQTGQSIAYAGVAITNVPGTCGILQRRGDPPNAAVLSMVVSEPGTAIAPGTYAVTTGSSGNVIAREKHQPQG